MKFAARMLDDKAPPNKRLKRGAIIRLQKDEKGNFSLQLKSGTYALTVRYAYGFSRTLYVVVSDRDLQCGSHESFRLGQHRG